MKHILVFSGSQRQDSLNRRLAFFLAQQLEHDFTLDVVDTKDIDFPLFNQDDERNPEILKKIFPIYQRFLQADGFVMVCPEYNGSVTPFLKNTIDWISRLSRIAPDECINPLQEKPMLLASATAGMSGGILGLQAARNIFNYLGSLVLAEQICMPQAAHAWNDGGFPKDTYLLEIIHHAVGRLSSVLYPSV